MRKGRCSETTLSIMQKVRPFLSLNCNYSRDLRSRHYSPFLQLASFLPASFFPVSFSSLLCRFFLYAFLHQLDKCIHIGEGYLKIAWRHTIHKFVQKLKCQMSMMFSCRSMGRSTRIVQTTMDGKFAKSRQHKLVNTWLKKKL